MQLQPLGLSFPNDLQAGIFSIGGSGGSNGTLSIGYKPCTYDGNEDEEELPEEFLVEEIKELVGQKDLYFKLFITGATDLPKSLNSDTFV